MKKWGLDTPHDHIDHTWIIFIFGPKKDPIWDQREVLIVKMTNKGYNELGAMKKWGFDTPTWPH